MFFIKTTMLQRIISCICVVDSISFKINQEAFVIVFDACAVLLQISHFLPRYTFALLWVHRQISLNASVPKCIYASLLIKNRTLCDYLNWHKNMLYHLLPATLINGLKVFIPRSSRKKDYVTFCRKILVCSFKIGKLW